MRPDGAALLAAFCVAFWICWRPCWSSDCAVVEGLCPVSELMIVGISLTSGSKKPDDGLPHWVSVARTAADKPLEWLVASRRQMPARRSRRRPAR